MGKRCLAMVVYNPASAAKAAVEQQRAAKRARPSPTDAGAGAVVPYNAAAAAPPADAQPTNAVHRQQPKPPAPPLSTLGTEPPCLRRHLLWTLRLRGDLPMHFIDKKAVTWTDLDTQQNRFRIPTNGVLQRLRPLLTLEELDAANLLYDPEPRAKPPKQLPQPENSAAANDGSSEHKTTKKKTGRVHGGLPVRLVDLAAGASEELQLCRWDSSHGTMVKGKWYLDFIRQCSFKEKDVVEIWAFKQHYCRYFGVTMCQDSILHLFIVKRDNTPNSCCYCPPPVNQAT